MREFQKHAVIIAMDDSANRTVPVIPDGIAAFLYRDLAFRFRRYELAGDRIIGIADIDEIGEGGRDPYGIYRGNGAQTVDGLRPNKAGICQIL
jgi:hypothetical protein